MEWLRKMQPINIPFQYIEEIQATLLGPGCKNSIYNIFDKFCGVMIITVLLPNMKHSHEPITNGVIALN